MIEAVPNWNGKIGYEEATFQEGRQNHVIVGRPLITVRGEHHDGSSIKITPPQKYIKFFRYVSTFLTEPAIIKFPSRHIGGDLFTAYCVHRDFHSWDFESDRSMDLGFASDTFFQFGELFGCYNPASIRNIQNQLTDALTSLTLMEAEQNKEIIIGIRDNSKIVAAVLHYAEGMPAIQAFELPFEPLKIEIKPQLALPWGSDWEPLKRIRRSNHPDKLGWNDNRYLDNDRDISLTRMEEWLTRRR